MASRPSVESLRDTLTNPDVYPHSPDSVTLRQTHISLVALVPPWVYKVKKPVELGFLDFSSLEQRRKYCQKEVQLNRRLCEHTYEGVVAIRETAEGIRVDPADREGEVIEYAVKMHYLDPEFFLDRQLDRGTATTSDIDRVADTLAVFYTKQSSTAAVAEAGWTKNLRVSTDENFEQTADHVGRTLSRPVYDALRYYTDRFYDQHASLLHRRRANGHFIEGHGDLRLEHVHLTDDRVCIYDCIEFNERFRHLDIANDIAFLAMDLDYHGRPRLARRLVRRMAEALNDHDLPSLIDFYKCYRAFVRGKVEGMKATEDEVPRDERAESRQSARRYYQWALRYAVAGSTPSVIVVFGKSGTGKSTQAAALSRALGWAHIASDRVRKTHAGVPLHQRTDAEQRDRLYSDRMSDVTYHTLRQRAVERGQNHQGTILDATYSDPARREHLRSALQDAGLPYAFIELRAPNQTLRDRLVTRTADVATASDARAEDFEMLNDRYHAPSALEDPYHVRVRSDDPPEDTTLAILKALIRLHD